MKKYLLILLGLCLVQTYATAQQTGSFDDNISFNNQTRALSNFVPTNYDPAQSYRLVIGLHGAGDNSGNYRNALVNALNFEAAFPNTILICPDGGSDPSKDFYTPAGDEGIIQEAINYASTNYNIDASDIILQGFSLGGRSALRYGLDHPADFKGLLLNTPAIQGVKEANNNGFMASYNYANASQVPVYLTIGATDDLYLAPIAHTIRHLVENNTRLAMKLFNGGHTIPDFQNYPYTAFFNQPYSTGLDASLYTVTTPVRSCDGRVSGAVLLQNTGDAPLQSVELSYGIGSNRDVYTWQGTLATHEHTWVQLPAYQSVGLAPNTYDFEVEVLTLNQTGADAFADLNESLEELHVMTGNMPLPFTERFTSTADLEKWAFHNSGDFILPFDYTPSDSAVFTFNSIFVFDNAGTREEIISPKLDFSGQGNVYLHFKTDYNYVKYTANVFGIDTVFADSLEVLVSTDCGANYTSVFKAAGDDLTGHDDPIMNPLNIGMVGLDVDRGKYRSFMVDLSSYAGQANVQVKFSYISALGGYIYLDDVIVNNSPVSAKDLAPVARRLKLYPNPATEKLNISLEAEAINGIQVFDIAGRQVYAYEGNVAAMHSIDVSRFSKGAYWLKLQTEGGVIRRQFIVQ